MILKIEGSFKVIPNTSSRNIYLLELKLVKNFIFLIKTASFFVMAIISVTKI